MKRLGAIFLVVLLSQTAFAQFDSGTQLPYTIPNVFDFAGPGARAMGMGNAYMAISDDISGIGWNPAGIYRIDRPVMLLGYNSLSPRGTINAFELSRKQTSSINGLSQATLLFPFTFMKRNVTVGIAYNQSFDEEQNAAINLSFFQDNNPTDEDTVPSDYYEANFDGQFQRQVSALQFGFGTKLSKKLSLGVTLNAYSGSGYSNFLFNYRIDNFKDFNGTFGPGEQVYDIDIVYQILDSSSYSGLNFTLGTLYEAEKYNAALVIKTPFSLKQTSDYKSLPELYRQGQPTGASQFATYFDDQVVKVDIPWTVALGIAFKPAKSLIVDIDAEYEAYGSSEVLRRISREISTSGVLTETYQTQPIELVSTIALRGGIEYLLLTKSSLIPTIPLRAGLRYEQLPTQSLSSDFATYSKEAASGFSLGTGIHWQMVHLDVAYSYVSYELGYAAAMQLINGVEQDDFVNSPIFVEHNVLKAKDHRFSFSFTGVF